MRTGDPKPPQAAPTSHAHCPQKNNRNYCYFFWNVVYFLTMEDWPMITKLPADADILPPMNIV